MKYKLDCVQHIGNELVLYYSGKGDYEKDIRVKKPKWLDTLIKQEREEARDEAIIEIQSKMKTLLGVK